MPWTSSHHRRLREVPRHRRHPELAEHFVQVRRLDSVDRKYAFSYLGCRYFSEVMILSAPTFQAALPSLPSRSSCRVFGAHWQACSRQKHRVARSSPLDKALPVPLARFLRSSTEDGHGGYFQIASADAGLCGDGGGTLSHMRQSCDAHTTRLQCSMSRGGA